MVSGSSQGGKEQKQELPRQEAPPLGTQHQLAKVLLSLQVLASRHFQPSRTRLLLRGVVSKSMSRSRNGEQKAYLDHVRGAPSPPVEVPPVRVPHTSAVPGVAAGVG